MSNCRPVTQTVILAAGSGSRLEIAAEGIPKPLTRVGGMPLVAHALAHARAAGCDEAIIVVGHEGNRVRAAVEELATEIRVRFVENANPLAPNGVSLLMAERLAASQFFLQMVDHLFEEPVLARLTALPLEDGEAGRVLVDRAPNGLGLEDATKVRLRGKRVTAIGKRIEPWDAIDAGCFVLTAAVFDALRGVPLPEPRTVSSGMRQLASRGSLGAADIAGTAWVDVDTPADRDAAEALVRRGLAMCRP